MATDGDTRDPLGPPPIDPVAAETRRLLDLLERNARVKELAHALAWCRAHDGLSASRLDRAFVAAVAKGLSYDVLWAGRREVMRRTGKKRGGNDLADWVEQYEPEGEAR